MNEAATTGVVLLTGFLGSGKTTLLQRILALPDLSDAAVLINEFGEVGLDHHLIRHVDENIVMLANGCVCCTVRDDLGAAIRDLLVRRARGELGQFSRIVIETTGLADPTPILHTLLTDPILRSAVEVRSIVTTVDAVNGELHLERQPESVKQIALADHLVVTKTDIASPSRVAAIMATLRRINPSASIVTAAETNPADVVTSAGYRPGIDPVGIQQWMNVHAYRGASAPAHDDAIAAHVIELDDNIEWSAFAVWLTMLLHRHGGDVLRVKGMLDVRGARGPVVVHGVQHLIHEPLHLDAWPDADRGSRLVFITRGISGDRLVASLATFNRAAKRLAGGPEKSGIWPISATVGAEVGGRPYRRRGGLAWLK